MAERRQLPPQIRRVELARRAGSKPVVRYQLTVDTGLVDGNRKQLRRRYLPRRKPVLRSQRFKVRSQRGRACSRQHSPLRKPARLGCAHGTRFAPPPPQATNTSQPIRSELGELAVQDLTRRHIDELIMQLRGGTIARPGGRPHGLERAILQFTCWARFLKELLKAFDQGRAAAARSYPVKAR